MRKHVCFYWVVIFIIYVCFLFFIKFEEKKEKLPALPLSIIPEPEQLIL